MTNILDSIGQVGGAPFNALIGGKAAVTAGEQQQQGIQNAENTVQNTYDQNSPAYQPFIQNGTAANNQATAMAKQGFNLSNFQQNPAYAFNMQQGLNAINNSQSVRGGALSGGAQKAASGYAQQNASNAYQNAYNQYSNNISQLTGLSSQGLSATQGLGQLGSNYASQMGNLQTGMGNSQASETLGKAGAFESAFGPYGQTAQGGQGNALSGLVGGLSSAFSSTGTPTNTGSSYAGYDSAAATNEQAQAANEASSASAEDTGVGAFANAFVFA